MGIFKHLQGEIDDRDKREGITLAELLDLPTPLRRLMKQITRLGEMTLTDAAEFVGESEQDVSQMLNTLVEKGYLEREQEGGIWTYRIRFARKRARSLPPGIWSALGDKVKDE